MRCVRRQMLAWLVALSIGGWVQPADAEVIVLPPEAFVDFDLIDFGPTQTFAPIHGQVINGVTFRFTIGGSPSADAVIDGGPGVTNNVFPANIEGNTFGVLSMLFPDEQTHLAYGYAVLAVGNVANATRVELFDGLDNSVGVLFANAASDPLFSGGFVGLQSTISFVRADVSFNSQAAPRFAFDNVRFQAIPEPTTLVLLGTGVVGLVARARRRQR